MTQPDEQQEDRLTGEALDWLARIGLGDATQEDLVALRCWRDTSPAHAAALTRAGDLWRVLETPVAEFVKDDSARRRDGFHPSRRALLAGGAGAIAAATIGVMMVRPPLDLWPSFAELKADYRTGTGEQQQLTLAQTVSVELNTRTSIAVRSGQEAAIELISGETVIAIPRVAPKPFVVFAAEGRATSQRGAFNIRRRDDRVEIACIHGEVFVQCSGSNALLEAGQRIAYGRDGLGGVAGTDVAALTAWREGMLVFRNTPLTSVIDEVNRYRPGRIVLIDSSLGQRLVTARFEIKRLDTVMGQISHVFKVPIKSFPGGLVLVG